MNGPGRIVVRRLGAADVESMRRLNALFAEAFEDPASYLAEPPGDDWLSERLGREGIVVLTAWDGNALVGGLVAYELDKLERARRELYIYDLAVAEAHRRRGAATALIAELQTLAAARGAWVVYVQADYGDDPAIALYGKLGTREEVLHFDMPPRPPGGG